VSLNCKDAILKRYPSVAQTELLPETDLKWMEIDLSCSSDWRIHAKTARSLRLAWSMHKV